MTLHSTPAVAWHLPYCHRGTYSTDCARIFHELSTSLFSALLSHIQCFSTTYLQVIRKLSTFLSTSCTPYFPSLSTKKPPQCGTAHCGGKEPVLAWYKRCISSQAAHHCSHQACRIQGIVNVYHLIGRMHVAIGNRNHRRSNASPCRMNCICVCSRV